MLTSHLSPLTSDLRAMPLFLLQGFSPGDCILTGKYENRRWWLCDSHFAGKLLGSMRSFFGLP